VNSTHYYLFLIVCPLQLWEATHCTEKFHIICLDLNNWIMFWLDHHNWIPESLKDIKKNNNLICSSISMKSRLINRTVCLEQRIIARNYFSVNVYDWHHNRSKTVPIQTLIKRCNVVIQDTTNTVLKMDSWCTRSLYTFWTQKKVMDCSATFSMHQIQAELHYIKIAINN